MILDVKGYPGSHALNLHSAEAQQHKTPLPQHSEPENLLACRKLFSTDLPCDRVVAFLFSVSITQYDFPPGFGVNIVPA